MNAINIMKQSFRTAWTNKKLWIFGLFVAAASGNSGGGGEAEGQQIATGGTLPEWVIPVIIVAVLAGLAGIVMHIISESALIAGVKQTSADEGDDAVQPFGIKDGMRVGLRCFFRVTGLKILFGLAGFATVAVIAIPAALGGLQVLPLWLGIATTVLLALPAVPWFLTLHFLSRYALRFAVLEGFGVVESLRAAWDHIHGRVGESLKLLGVSILGVLASSLAMGIVIIPGAIVGGLTYLAAGLIPAIVAGSVLAIPCILCVQGFLGTYRSGVWTLGFLEARGEV